MVDKHAYYMSRREELLERYKWSYQKTKDDLQNDIVELYKRMHKEFDNTELDSGVNKAWFDEFGPEYCTNCTNCGEKFFLLEKNGDNPDVCHW